MASSSNSSTKDKTVRHMEAHDELAKQMEKALKNETEYHILVGNVRNTRGNTFESKGGSFIDTTGVATEVFIRALHKALGNHFTTLKDLHGDDTINALATIALTPPKGFDGGIRIDGQQVVIESVDETGGRHSYEISDGPGGKTAHGLIRVPALMAIFHGLEIKLNLKDK